jgi:hypothetical protein
METIEFETPYGAPRDETAGVPPGMEAFGPIVIAAPLSRAEAEAAAAQALSRIAKSARRR